MKSKFESRFLCIAVTLLCLLSAQIVASPGGLPFTRIFAVGDSLTDTGNFHARSGGIPPPPYFDGRFSNGPLWIEYLAENLGMELLPSDNFAVGGATTGALNSNNGVAGQNYSGVQQQIADLLAAHPSGLDPDALYIVWAGANDFFVVLETGGDPAALIADGVGNTAVALQTLWAAGARHIIVPNIPDLGLTPYAQSSGAAPVITFLCGLYNQALEGALAALNTAGIATIRLDAFSALNRMVNSPDDFGFTNVGGAYIFTGGQMDEFLFWDAVHPTTAGHAVLGSDAVSALVRHFSPWGSQKNADGRVNSLNGLVHAKSHR
ncbi:MAG: SGNH/GDSL hydrolase family protein [Limisphaerales bacterium]